MIMTMKLLVDIIYYCYNTTILYLKIIKFDKIKIWFSRAHGKQCNDCCVCEYMRDTITKTKCFLNTNSDHKKKLFYRKF